MYVKWKTFQCRSVEILQIEEIKYQRALEFLNLIYFLLTKIYKIKLIIKFSLKY